MGVKNFIGEMIGVSVVLSAIKAARIVLYASHLEAGVFQLHVELSKCNLYSYVLVAYNRNIFSDSKGILASYGSVNHIGNT